MFSAVASPRPFMAAALAVENGVPLKLDRRSSVVRIDGTPEGAVVVKTRLTGRLKDRLNAALRRSQAQREVRGAAALHRLGVPTAQPLLLVRGSARDGLGARESLVSRALPGRTLLALMDDAARRRPVAPSFAQRAAVARAVGAQLRAFSAARRFNRDHKPSNLIVMFDDSPPEIAVIDAVAIRRDRLRIGGLRMLTSLMLEPLGCGCPPSRTMRMRALIEATKDERRPAGAPLAARKAAWRAVAQAIEEHGDPQPRVNPLA